MMKKWLVIALVVSLCFGQVLAASATETESMNEAIEIADSTEDQIIQIPDAFLKERLLIYADNDLDGELSKKELSALEYLYLNNSAEECKQVDMTGLEYAVNLRDISFENSYPISFDELASLGKLQYFAINNSDLQDASGVSELKHLHTLFLTNNQLDVVPSLENMTELYSIYFSGNQITKIPSFAGMENLNTMDFSNNLITEIASFEEMKSLSVVYLSDNQIEDISALKGCVYDVLDLGENPISDLSSIAEIYQNINMNLYLSPSDVISWETLFENCIGNDIVVSLINGNSIDKTPIMLNAFYKKMRLDGSKIDLGKVEYEIQNTDIAKIEEDTIVGVNTGNTECILKYENIEKNITLQVVERESEVKNTLQGEVSIKRLAGAACAYIDDTQTLWGINTNKAEEIVPNVQQYIAEFVYGEDDTSWGNYYALDMDNQLWKCIKNSFEEAYRNELLYQNVKKYDDEFVLLETGDLFRLASGEKIAENIEKYVESAELYALSKNKQFVNVYDNIIYAEGIDDFYVNVLGVGDEVVLLSENTAIFGHISENEFVELSRIEDVSQLLDEYSILIKNDGSVWRWDFSPVTLTKIADEMPLMLEEYYMIDKNNVLWRRNENTYYQVMENVSSIGANYIREDQVERNIIKTDGTLWLYNEGTNTCELQEDTVKVIGNYYLRADGTLWEGNNYVIGDVVDFGVHLYFKGGVYAVRADGSIWMYAPDEGINVPVKVKDGVNTKGDLSGDTAVSMKDVQIVFSFISGKTELTESQLLAADVNDDGQVTTNDMQRIFYYVNGKIEEL